MKKLFSFFIFISILMFSCDQSVNMLIGVGQALDNESPKISVTSPENGIYVNRSNITITGKCSDNVGVTRIKADAGLNDVTSVATEEISLRAVRDGSWTITFDADKLDRILNLWRSGLKVTFTLTCYDAAGNSVVEHIFLYIDTELPEVTINLPETRFKNSEKEDYEKSPSLFAKDYDMNKFEKVNSFVNKEFTIKGYVDDNYSVKSTYINIYDTKKNKIVAVTRTIFRNGTSEKVQDDAIGQVTGNSQSWEFVLNSMEFCQTEGWYAIEVVTEDEAGNEKKQFVDKHWMYINQNADIPRNNFTSFSPGFKLNAGNVIAGNGFDDDGMKEVWIKIVPESEANAEIPYTDWKEDSNDASHIIKKCADFTSGAQLGNWSLNIPSKAGNYIIYAIPVDIGDVAPQTPYEGVYASYFSVASEEDPVVGVDSQFRGSTIVENTDITGSFYDNNKVTKIKLTMEFDEDEKPVVEELYDSSKNENAITIYKQDNTFQLTTGQIVIKNFFKWHFDVSKYKAFKVLKMTFRSEDEDGNYGEDAITIYGDSERPAFSSEILPKNNTEVAATNVFSGKVSDNVDVVSVIIKAGGSAWEDVVCELGEAEKVNGKTIRTFKSREILPAEFGGYIDREFTVTACDAAGNEASQIITLKGDKTKPVVKFIDENAVEEKSGNYVTTDKVLTASVKPMIFGDGSYRKITKVNYSVNGSELKSLPFDDFNGEYYPVKIKVADLGNISGDVTVQLTAVDDASSDGQGTIYFIVDNEPPTDLAITSPLLKDKDYITTLTSEINDINENEISFYQNKEMILKGTISDNYKISKTILEISKVDSDSECTLELVVGKDGKLTLSSEEDKSDAIIELSGIPGNFTIKLDTEKLSDGDYILKTTSYDAAGNSTSWGDEENAENEEYYFKVLQDADKPRITFNLDFNDKMEAGIFPGTILKGSFVDDDAMKENGVKYLLSGIELDDSAVKEKFEKSSETTLDNVKEFTRQDWQLDEFQSVGTQYLYMQAEDINGEKSDIYKRKITVTSTESPFVKSVSSAPVTAGGESNGYYSGMVKIIVNADGGSCGVKDLMYRITSSSVESTDDIVEHAASEGNFALGTPTSGDLGKWHKYTFIDIDESNRENVEFVFDSRLFADNKNETINVEVKCVNAQVTESITVKDKIAIDNEGPTLKIASPILGTSVNKIFDINGSCNDKGSGVQNVYVGYFKSDVTSITHTDIKNNLSNKAESNKWNKLTVDGISWDGRFDSEIIHNGNDKKDYMLALAAVDNLNNVSIIEHEIKIDQNTDRPIIRLQNLDLSSNGTIWHKSAFIYGTVSDDDSGNVDVRISEDGGKNWSENCFANGSWSYTFKDDGEKVLAFKVTDGAGTTFTSADNDGLTVPKIVDSQGNQKSESKFNLKVDTQDPKMIDVYFNVKPTNKDEDYQPQTPAAVNNIDSSVWTSSFSGKVFGGTENAIWFMFGGNDANGIASGDLTCITENSGAVIGELIAENNNETAFYKCKIDISKVELTLLTFKVEIKDKSGLVSQKSFTVDIDNMAPTINFNSHTDGSDIYGTENNTVKGSAADSNKIIKVEYALTAKETDIPNFTELDTINLLNWEIPFKDENIFNNKLLNLGVDLKDKNVVDLFLWVSVTDELGNVGMQKKRFDIIPNGDVPKIEIDNPEKRGAGEELEILGGLITISGTTDISVGKVAQVYVQIDPSYNESTFSVDWDTELEDINKNLPDDVKYQIESIPNTNMKGIKVSSKSMMNWRLSNINASNELDGTVAVKAIAVSESGKYTESDVVAFKVDRNVPIFEELYLVQKDAGNEVKRQKYEPDMWISGAGWQIEGTITDNEGIEESSIKCEPSSYDLETSVKSLADSGNNYNFVIPLNTVDFGNVKLTVSAIDVSQQRYPASQIFIINYDNTKPEFSVKQFSLEKTERTKIENSSGVYPISGSFNEDSKNGYNQSGFERIAMYFTRTVNDETYIIDPMLQKGDDGDDNRYSVSDFEKHDGMYWKKVGVSTVTGSEITLSVDVPANVRRGGLCKIDGIIYRIDEITGTDQIGVSGTPSSVATEIYFALAQVIDNFVIENGKTTYYEDSANKDKIEFDDGDEMVEGVREVGTKAEWTVSINSENIFDGNVDIHFVAFDKAGNTTSVDCYGKVANNSPRIAGVAFGTDKDSSKNIEDKELIKSYYNLYDTNASIDDGRLEGVSVNGMNGMAKVTQLNIPLEGDLAVSQMLIKDSVGINAKVVGGNGGLQWQWKIGTSDWSELKDLNVGSSYGDDIRSDLSMMNITMADFLGVGVGNLTNTNLCMRIWDKTEGTTVGVDSQYAEINVIVDTILVDMQPPTVTINPFYWNSETDNSLYQKKRANGHIELEKDLTKAITDKLGSDPKVSGKITIEGTATDNVLLKELIMTIPGFKSGSEFTMATYANGSWTSVGNMDSDGWTCEVVPDETEENDHKVNWKFHWDTSKISNTVAKDVKVSVKATDRGKAILSGDKITITYDSNTCENPATKQMDVVPYITGLDTTLTDLEKKNPSVYGRSALGKYPIYYYRKTTSGGTQVEPIIVEGFNIKSEATVTFAGGATATLNDDMSFTLPSNAKSGEIKITVIDSLNNGIDSLNNINNNEAKGGYNDNSYENYYNRQPNGQNNDILTDNVEIAIWEINSKAAIAESGELSEVVMHVNPLNGMLGFAFAHSQDLASYPNGNESSYQTWITDWTGVNQIGFVYDQNGNVFGTNGGTDTYTPDKKTGRLGLISSHWGIISDKSGNGDKITGYTNYRRLRLEYLGITRNGTYASNVNRFAKGDCTQLATTTSGDYTNLYMMYYDNTLGELKFKAGAYDNTWSYGSGWRDDVNLETFSFNKADFSFGDFADDAYNQSDNTAGTNYEPNYATTSIVANQSGANGNPSVRPGIYYSISVVPATKSETGSDVVVAVWYDDTTNKTLWYSYLKNPLAKAGNRNENGAISTEWATPIAILDGHAGGYCAIKADDDGHIHIAAYSRNNAGSLYYAYLDNYQASFDKEKNLVAVDSYGSQGQYITMEVAKNSAGKTIPYIGYYMNSLSYPKYAYLTDTTSSVSSGYYPKAGVDEDNMYTGAWETIMLPTTSTLVLDDINIGVYKDDKGKLQAIPTQSETAGEKSGIAGGNGTSNPIFGYGITQTGSGYIETAQLK